MLNQRIACSQAYFDTNLIKPQKGTFTIAQQALPLTEGTQNNADLG